MAGLFRLDGVATRPWRASVKTAVAVACPAVLARVGLPALGAVVLIVIITAGVLCWILASKDRSDHAAQLIGAARGQPAPVPMAARARSRPVGARGETRREGAGDE